MNRLSSIRKDWRLIESLIDHNAKVMDIGCGDGGLIEQLQKNINAKTHGIEINPKMTRKSIAKGLNVIQGDAEIDLAQYSNQSFDYVILSQTLQAMVKPKDILIELLRIGGKAIVSFPNFGHWKIRFQLLINGKMPVTQSLPYAWYETPNIHFFTIKDFEKLCKDLNIIIEKGIGLTTKGRQFDITINRSGANFFTHEAIFLLSYQTYEPIKLKSTKKSYSKNSALVGQ